MDLITGPGKYGINSGKMQSTSSPSSKGWNFNPGQAANIAHAGGTLLDVVSYLRDPTSKAYRKAGKYAKQGADFENAQLKAKGQEALAIGQRGQMAEQDATNKAISRAIAVAAGSGGGASDPTVMSIIGNLASEGNTNALSALYSGQSEQVAYENEILANTFNAKATSAGYKYKAKATSQANWDNAFGSLLDGASTFLEKYG